MGFWLSFGRVEGTLKLSLTLVEIQSFWSYGPRIAVPPTGIRSLNQRALNRFRNHGAPSIQTSFDFEVGGNGEGIQGALGLMRAL